MEQEELERTTAEAVAAMQEERLRTRSGFPSQLTDPDIGTVSGSARQPGTGSGTPGGESGRLSDEERAFLHDRLKALKGAPASLLQKLDFNAMLQLNESLAREDVVAAKRAEEAKLSENYDELLGHPVPVRAGFDDRIRQLHASRFLGGAGCAAQALWARAREVQGNDGVKAISTYDMDAVGSGGSVTPRGWSEIHNAASLNLSLKQFHLPNVGGDSRGTRKPSLADGESAVEVGDSAREVTDLQEFMTAL